MRTIAIIAGAMLLAGCGGAETPKAEDEAIASKLDAGLYDVAGEVTSLASTDKTSPATKLAKDAKTGAQACVEADGKPDAALFAEAGDKCTTNSSYVRNGRLNMQYQCTRPGNPGYVMVTVDGSFTKNGFEGTAQSQTGFAGMQ